MDRLRYNLDERSFSRPSSPCMEHPRSSCFLANSTQIQRATMQPRRKLFSDVHPLLVEITQDQFSAPENLDASSPPLLDKRTGVGFISRTPNKVARI
ncbi:hypothetical protein PUN28_005533 [Cardiocondyla obscurior]|uniref:Uncharacterized protein n=1 Tax=Cardiocondyla obscurior TaxID=286306 RepID=A0AAW2GIB0_9HYME